MVSLPNAPQGGEEQGVGRMRLFASRRLTEGEAQLGRRVFGDTIAYRRMRVVQLPPLGFGAMVPFGRTIYFSNWRALRDFSRASMDEQGWFIHELAHAWQAHASVVLALAKLSALGRRAYRVDPARPFERMNIESQAEVARFLFLARAGAPDKAGPSVADLERLWTTAPRRRRRKKGGVYSK
jgi:hypothetical protein